MRALQIAILVVGCAAILWPSDQDDVNRGRDLFEKRCTGCHALDGLKVGPPLRNVFGRQAAADPAFPYSEALKKSGLIWNEAALDRWLKDPEALAADTDMSFRLERSEERAVIIAYLRSLTPNRRQTR